VQFLSRCFVPHDTNFPNNSKRGGGDRVTPSPDCRPTLALRGIVKCRLNNYLKTARAPVRRWNREVCDPRFPLRLLNLDAQFFECFELVVYVLGECVFPDIDL